MFGLIIVWLIIVEQLRMLSYIVWPFSYNIF